MNIRDGTEGDLPAIVAIYNSIVAGRVVTADLEPTTVEARLSWFRAHSSGHRPIWVAEADAQVVGWLSFDPFFARAAYDGTAMVAIYVEALRRRSGIGQALLARALERAPGLNLHTLLGYIFAHNEPSLRFFDRFGFERWAHLPRVAVLDGVARDLIIVGRRVSG